MSLLTDTSVIFKKLDWKPPSGAEHGRSRSQRPAERPRPAPAGPRPTPAAAPHAAGMAGSSSRSFSPSSSSSSSSSPSSSAAGGAALPCSCSSSAPGGRPAAAVAAGGLCSDMAPLPSRQPPSACRYPDPAPSPLPTAAEEPRRHPRRRRSAVMQQRSCSRTPGHPRTAGRSAALPPSPRPGEEGQRGTERRGGGRTRCPGAVKLHRRATYSPRAAGGAVAAAAMLFIGAS